VYAVSDDMPADLEASLRIMFPDLTFALWHGPGHFLHMEEPSRLNAEMFAFLAAHGL
jgi:pimeloyl-ACP methyl ester carboxylesterase